MWLCLNQTRFICTGQAEVWTGPVCALWGFSPKGACKCGKQRNQKVTAHWTPDGNFFLQAAYSKEKAATTREGKDLGKERRGFSFPTHCFNLIREKCRKRCYMFLFRYHTKKPPLVMLFYYCLFTVFILEIIFIVGIVYSKSSLQGLIFSGKGEKPPPPPHSSYTRVLVCILPKLRLWNEGIIPVFFLC